MSRRWEHLYRPISDAERLITRVKDDKSLDEDTVEMMDRVIVELRFLYTFLGYAHKWSDAALSSPDGTHFLSLFSKVGDLAKELTTIDRFTADPQKFNTKVAMFCTTARHPGSKSFALLCVFTSLYKKIAPLKPQIREAYQQSLSGHSIHPHPPSSTTRTEAWDFFCACVESNLQYLSEEKSSFSEADVLRNQMKALKGLLNSLKWLLCGCSYDWCSWKENMMAHFGGMVVQAAHVCCLSWYAQVDQIMEKDIAILLSNLHQDMDPTSPQFLKTTLGFLGPYNGKDSEISISAFVHHILGEVDETDVLHKEWVSLLTCLIKIPESCNKDEHEFSVGIKDVLMDSRYLIHKNKRNYKTHLAVLFAKIWSLKAEIYIKSRGTLLSLSKDDQVQALHKGYAFLRNIFTPTEKKTEHQILKLIEELPGQVRFLYQSSEYSCVRNKVSNILYKCLVHIMLLNAKALVLDLLENVTSLMLPLKYRLETLHEGLFFLIEFLTNKTLENWEEEKLILKDIEVVAYRLIYLCYQHPADKVTEASVMIMDCSLSKLLEKFQHLTEKLSGLYLQIPRLTFPKTPGLCFIQLFLQNLRSLLRRKHGSIAHSTLHIEAICRDLEFIISEFGDVFKQGIDKQECKDLYVSLVDVVYQVEHVINSMEDDNEAVWQLFLWLYRLWKEIRGIKMQLGDFNGNNPCDDRLRNVPQRLMPFELQVRRTNIEKDMVGLNDQKEVIINQLSRGTSQRDIVSVVGMPGIGKTTLANNVFCSPHVMCHFPIRAWCCVSRTYIKRDLLLNILSHVTTVTDNTHAMSDADLSSMLYKCLKRNRYLIVMDDMWSTEAWDDLQLSFPDDKNGSRILLTSRLQDVVSKISDPRCLCPLSEEEMLKEKICRLRPLSEEESWELLKKKIFWEKDCPERLLEIGQQIAKNCKGLPLAICAIAGLLDKTNKNEDLWKQISESVSSRILKDPETPCKGILELSYDHLPDHLKACLLYFGAFPEDKDIPVWRLQWLWIAEGFVCKLEHKSLEDLAEDYLMDLIGRSLVTVARTGSNGKVKTCQVHDVVRDLCLLKATDDKFLQLISGNDEPYSSFDRLDYGVYYDLFTPSNSTTYKEYRLCFCVNRAQFVASRPSGPFVRSLLFFATTDMYPRCPFDGVSFVSNNFKRLRVLDLESINMGNSFANGIELLVDLRYLAVCGDMDSIPSCLSKLENLETLLVKGLKGKVQLPDSIWRMENLRHIRVSNRAIFPSLNEKDGRSSQLVSLVTLSLPSFSDGEETNIIITRFPNLRKLKCIFVGPTDISVDFWQFPALESLSKLESLKISYYGKAINTRELNLPSSLTKLTLSNFRLPWNQISAIGKLQNLEVLKLVSRAFEGSSWDMKEGEFLKLKYLKLDTLNIIHWDATDDHLPQLQQLVLRNCKQLKEVPFDFGSISTLQKIEVQQCGNAVEDSVKKIELEEIEGLRIVINESHST